MPSSCGQPIILSVITTDLGSCRVDEREHFFCYADIIADIGPFGEPASKVVASASAAGTMPTVRLVALVSSGP